MGLFGKKKIVDLTEGYNLRNAKPVQTPQVEKTSTSSSGSFFDLSENSGSESSSSYSSESSYSRDAESLNPEEKRRRLAKRLKNMTDRMEELSNSIYLLQQRIEVLERKTNVNSYE